jgi:hypothetical protein
MRIECRIVQAITIVLILVIGLAFPVSAQTEYLEIDAPMVEFNPDQQIYIASGGVIFKKDNFLLTAEKVIYDRKQELIKAEERVRLSTPSGTWEGDRAEYSFKTEKGEITSLKGSTGKILVSGSKGKIDGEHFNLEKADITRCNLSVPCIKIKAKKVNLVEQRAKLQGAWLYIKKLPVLPLPPLTVPTDNLEGWPKVEAGYNNTRGLYLYGRIDQETGENSNLYYGVGAGTKKWLSLQGGWNWHLTPDLLLSTGLNWEPWNKLTGNGSLSYKLPGAEFTAKAERGWNSSSTGTDSFKIKAPLFSRTKGELIYSSSFVKNQTNTLVREEYGGRITGPWIPGFTLGTGVIHGTGDLGGRGPNGWYLETSWNGGFELLPTWRVKAVGKTFWQKGAEVHWVNNTVSLAKDLHCFKAELGYNFVGKSIQFDLGINW